MQDVVSTTRVHEPDREANAQDRPGADRHSDAERREMDALGIAFDGRGYCYREYRYEALADALNYARLDRSKPGYRPTPAVKPPWRAPEEPTTEQRRLMIALGVSFDGRYFRYRDYRYDHLADALNYAQLRR